MSQVIIAIFAGIVAGFCRSLLGFFKNSESEELDWKKLLKAVIIMGITGGVIGLFTSNPLMAFGLSFTGGVTVHELIKAYQNKSFEPE
ncbi:unnamed protein product [marine sediment metagenome]|uniref:Holin n=1 Tax=marine sediment metagenome TaxID=412755 RepID=X0S9Y0_9ZZZZ